MNIQQLIEERLRALDPTIDLSSSSPAQALVVEPLLRAFSPDALSADVRELLRAKLAEEYPDVTLGPGDAFTDILINACSLFLEPYRQVLSRISAAQNLSDPDALAADDIDALASNWLVARRDGRRATGVVSITLTTPRAVQISPAARFLTGDGRVFVSRASFTVSAAEALRGLNAAGQYVVSVRVTSESVGAAYNIPAGSIQSATGIGVYASVTNPAEFIGGQDVETSTQFLRTRLPQVIHERSLVTEAGVVANVLSGILNVDSVAVAGFGDVEMRRDVASVEGGHLHIVSGVAVLGAGFVIVSARPDFRIAVGDVLHGQSADGTRREARVTGVLRDRLPNVLVQGYGGFVVRIAERFSPMVFAYTSVLRPGEVLIGGEPVSSETHLGGRVDVYINPQTDSTETASVTLTPLGGIEGVGCSVAGRRVTLTGLNGRARRGQFLVFDELSVRRAALILAVKGDLLWVDTTLSNIPPQAQWRVVDRIDTHLTAAPQTLATTFASTIVGSRVVGLPVSDTRDVIAGDTLSVPDIGRSYAIESVGAGVVTLTEPVDATGLFQSEITRARSGVNAPLTRLDELADITYGECLGVSVLTASDAQELRAGGECRLLPKLGALYPNGLASTHLSDSGYEVVLPWPLNVRNQATGQLPYRFGTANPRGGTGVISVQMERPAGNVITATQAEIELPLDLFVPGAYNVIVAYGDLDVDKVIEAASAYYARSDSAEQLLRDAIPTNMLPPAPAAPGDVVSAFGGEWVVDREYRVEIVFNTADVTFPAAGMQRVTALDYTRVLRLSLLRLRELLPAPLLSIGEVDMEPQADVDVPGALALPDLLRALLKPDALMTGNATQTAVSALVQQQGFTPAPSVTLSLMSRSDAGLFTLTRPSEGTARLYFEAPQTVELRAPHFARYTHDEALDRMDSGEAREQRDFFRAQDLRIRSEGGAVFGGDDPRAWPRAADLRSVQFDVLLGETYSTAAFVGDFDEHEGLLDRVEINTGVVPTGVVVDPLAGDELAVLQRSLTIDTKPPTVERLYFVLRSAILGVTPHDTTIGALLQSGDIYNFIVTEDGQTAHRALVNRALRVDGMTVETFFQELSTAPDAPVNTQSPREIGNLDSREIFYAITPSALKTSRPYVSTAARTSRLQLTKLYESQTFDLRAGIERDLARVLSSADASGVSDVIRGVDVESDALTVDRVMSLSTAPIVARGWGRVFRESADELVIEGAMIGSLANRTVPVIADNFSGVGVGGTTRLLALSDTGAYITLVNTTWHPQIDGEPDFGVAQIDHGTFKVESVNQEAGFDAPLFLSRPYRSTVTLSAQLSFSRLPETAQHMDVFFLLTDRVPVPQEELKACRPLDIYAREPLFFKINAVPREEDGYVLVSTQDDESASELGVGPLRRANVGNVQYNPTLCDALPFAIIRPGARRVTASGEQAGLYYADVPYMSVSSTGIAAGEARVVTSRIEHDGFSLVAEGEAFSVNERPRVMFPAVSWASGARVERMSDVLTAKYTRALPVSDAHLQFASPRNRVLCSDLLARRMLPARVGVYMRYTGGSSADVIREDVRTYIESQARSREPIDVSDLTGLVYRRGVDRVLSPTHVLIYVEDLDRRRHVLVVTERFDIDTDVFYTGTARITSARAPFANGLGITLDIERV